MSTSIFIKTWKGDLPWLPYCLESINKYASGFEHAIIMTDQSCHNDTLKILKNLLLYVPGISRLNLTLLSVPDWDNGYIQQQYVKLNAYKYTTSDNVLFVDSDCVFYKHFSPASYMVFGQPILMKTKYGNLEGAEAWKPITESFVGFEVQYEYMRRLPWMYRRESLINFSNRFPNLEQFLKGMKTRDFSEFNALGACIDKYESEDYYVTDTELWTPEAFAKQYWSWGGITPEIQLEINQFLKG